MLTTAYLGTACPMDSVVVFRFLQLACKSRRSACGRAMLLERFVQSFIRMLACFSSTKAFQWKVLVAYA